MEKRISIKKLILINKRISIISILLILIITISFNSFLVVADVITSCTLKQDGYIGSNNLKQDILCKDKKMYVCGSSSNPYGTTIDTGKFDALCAKNSEYEGYSTWYESDPNNDAEKIGNNGVTAKLGTIITANNAGNCEYIAAKFPNTNPKYESWIGCNCKVGPNGVKANKDDNYAGYYCFNFNNNYKWYKQPTCSDSDAKNIYKKGIVKYSTDTGYYETLDICKDETEIAEEICVNNERDVEYIKCTYGCNFDGACYKSQLLVKAVPGANKLLLEYNADIKEIEVWYGNNAHKSVKNDVFSTDKYKSRGGSKEIKLSDLGIQLCSDKFCNEIYIYLKYKKADNKWQSSTKLNRDNCYDYDFSKTASENKKASCNLIVEDCSNGIDDDGDDATDCDDKECYAVVYTTTTEDDTICLDYFTSEEQSYLYCDSSSQEQAIGDYICENKKWTKKICSDTDGGQDISKKGTVISNTGTETDFCPPDELDKYVNEYYCENLQLKSISKLCNSGFSCANGACTKKTCSDTDGGQDILKKGTVTSNTGTETDFCPPDELDKYVNEYYCENLQLKSISKLCNSGFSCIDGFCENQCANNKKDNDETGIDCGGQCNACVSCNDAIKNQDEEGVDCGGSCPNVCIPAGIEIKCAKKVQKPDATVMNYNVCEEEKDCPLSAFYCKSDNGKDNCIAGCNNNNDCKLSQKCDILTKTCISDTNIKPNADYIYITEYDSVKDNIKLTATALFKDYPASGYFFEAYFPNPKDNYKVTAKKVAEFTFAKNIFPIDISFLLKSTDGKEYQKQITTNVRCNSKDYCKTGFACSLVSGQCEKKSATAEAESCTIAEDCSFYGYYCNSVSETCKSGCDSNIDCSLNEVCNLQTNRCLLAGKCASIDDCKIAGQSCNLKTEKCEKLVIDNNCKDDKDCIYAGTYCMATDKPKLNFKGICANGCNENRDCKYYQTCELNQIGIGVCADKSFTAEFTADTVETFADEVIVKLAPKENHFKETDYSWKIGSGSAVKSRNFWQYTTKSIFPETITLTVSIGGKTKTISREINIKCNSGAYCKSGYACNIEKQSCEAIPTTQKCTAGPVKECVSNEMCVQKNSITGDLECYSKDQVITIDELDTAGKKKVLQCGSGNVWCPEGFYYIAKSGQCTLSQEACYLPPFDKFCGQDTQLTYAWFNDKDKLGKLACFKLTGDYEKNNQACCLQQTINNVDYYEYANIKIY